MTLLTYPNQPNAGELAMMNVADIHMKTANDQLTDRRASAAHRRLIGTLATSPTAPANSARTRAPQPEAPNSVFPNSVFPNALARIGVLTNSAGASTLSAEAKQALLHLLIELFDVAIGSDDQTKLDDLRPSQRDSAMVLLRLAGYLSAATADSTIVVTPPAARRIDRQLAAFDHQVSQGTATSQPTRLARFVATRGQGAVTKRRPARRRPWSIVLGNKKSSTITAS